MNSTSTPLSPIFLVVRSLGLAAILLLPGCANNNGIFADGSAGSPKWFNSAEPDTEESVVISRDPKLLANGSEVEVAIHNAVELSRQKRFIEARHLLAEVRELQKPKSDGHRSVTCAMALLALREGDIGNFRRLARQLDTSLGKPVRVAPSYVEVISLYRAMNKENLPVNTPDGIRRFNQEFFPTQNAST